MHYSNWRSYLVRGDRGINNIRVESEHLVRWVIQTIVAWGSDILSFDFDSLSHNSLFFEKFFHCFIQTAREIVQLIDSSILIDLNDFIGEPLSEIKISTLVFFGLFLKLAEYFLWNMMCGTHFINL